MDENGKLIFNPSTAAYLCNRGCTIIKMKKNRHDPKSPVFVFLVNDHFNKIMGQYLEHIGNTKELKENNESK